VSECQLSPLLSGGPQKLPQHDSMNWCPPMMGRRHWRKPSCVRMPAPLRRERHGGITGPGTTVLTMSIQHGRRNCGSCPPPAHQSARRSLEGEAAFARVDPGPASRPKVRETFNYIRFTRDGSRSALRSATARTAAAAARPRSIRHQRPDCVLSRTLQPPTPGIPLRQRYPEECPFCPKEFYSHTFRRRRRVGYWRSPRATRS
jgi:hypothetical protein